MQNKFLIIGILAIAFSFANSGFVLGANNGLGVSGEQVKANNQENGEQVQIRVQLQDGTGGQVQEQDRVQLQDGTGGQVQQQQNGSGNEVQKQNMINNQGEEQQLQIQTQEQLQDGTGNQKNVSQQRRSQVAGAVQEILQLADNELSVGEQIRVIAQAQNQNQEKLENSLEKVQARNSFTKFFIGANYKEVNSAENILEQNQEQIRQLNEIKNQLINQEEQDVLGEQIQVLEQANLEIKGSLDDSQKGFSLLGWMFKLFAK